MLVLFLLALQASFDMEASGFNLIMQVSKKVVGVKVNEPYDLLCLSDVPLERCQINSYYLRHELYDILEDQEIDTAEYSSSGLGLQKGICGVTIKRAPDVLGVYIIYACRGRTFSSGWQYDTGMYQTVDGGPESNSYPVTMGPTVIFVDQGADVEITFENAMPFTQCDFKWPGVGTWTSSGSNENFSIEKVDGTKGTCGIKLFNVTGTSSCLMETSFRTAKGAFMGATTLVIKTPPDPPVLILNKMDGNYNNRDFIRASCFVSRGRPVARIEWLFGDIIIRRDDYDDSDGGADFKWEHEERCITQKVILQLTRADNGKELICRAEHIAWPGGRIEAKKKIYLRGSGTPNSDILLHLTWFLIGLAAVSLGATIAVACLIGTTYATKTWCFEITSE